MRHWVSEWVSEGVSELVREWGREGVRHYCVAVAWSDVSVFFLRDGGDCALSSFPKGTIRAQSRVASPPLGNLCVVPGHAPPHTRDSILVTHETSWWLFATSLVHTPAHRLADVSCQDGEFFLLLGRSHEPSAELCLRGGSYLKGKPSSNPCRYWSRSDELRSLYHSRMGADHTCSTSFLRAAHPNPRTCNALFGAARTNSAPEARTSGPFYRFKESLWACPSLLKCNVTSSVAGSPEIGLWSGNRNSTAS